MVDSNTVIEGTVKFRDGKKWKSRWCVMRKLSPVADFDAIDELIAEAARAPKRIHDPEDLEIINGEARAVSAKRARESNSDCLHLQLYRDSKDRYKQGHTKASLSLQHFLAIETGFTLDKESNTIAIICQDVTVILAFDTRERLMQWQVKIVNNLGEDQPFLIQITSAPPRAKISPGPARLHVQEQRFCLTSGVPPRLLGFWDISQLRRYGVVEGRFVFEGGSRCGKGEGVHVCVTDQAEEITKVFQMAAQGKITNRRRAVTRNMSVIDSPRRQVHSRASDVDSLQQSFIHNQTMSSDFSGDDFPCPCSRLHRDSSSPFWMSTETSATGLHSGADLDSNYGCGDAMSISDYQQHHHHQQQHLLHHHHPHQQHGESWLGATVSSSPTGRAASSSSAAAMERCSSCISKLGAASMSRSSTSTTSYPNTVVPFNPAWTMDVVGADSSAAASSSSPCHRHCACARSSASSGCDCMSLSSHGSSGGGGAPSEYCVPRSWSPQQPPQVPPKSPKTPPTAHGLPPSGAAHPAHPPTARVPPFEACRCQCCPPSRPPKPPQLSPSPTPTPTPPPHSPVTDSPSKKKMKKPPMPLPLVTEQPTASAGPAACACPHHPKVALLRQQHRSEAAGQPLSYDNYDVPKSLLGTVQTQEPKEESRQSDTLNRSSLSTGSTEEYYDTPKSIKDSLASTTEMEITTNQYGNYDVPPSVKTLRKPCGCVIKLSKKSVLVTSLVETTKLVMEHEDPSDSAPANCPCQKVMCWAENLMMLPYCRRGNGIENTGVPIQKVKLSGEGKMPVVNTSGEIAIYATVDKSKKNSRKHLPACSQGPCACPRVTTEDADQSSSQSNYVNVDVETESSKCATGGEQQTAGEEFCQMDTNYENIDFAQSLEYYENAKDVLMRAGMNQDASDSGISGTTQCSQKCEEASSVEYPTHYGTHEIMVCSKCGHECHAFLSGPMGTVGDADCRISALTESAEAAGANAQDDYLMMEPAKNGSASAGSTGRNHPGYLPMSPVPSGSTAAKNDLLKRAHQRGVCNLSSEKSASIPSLASPITQPGDKCCKRSELEYHRVPGAAMMMSPYLKQRLAESDDRAHQVVCRKRSSSADSRNPEALEDLNSVMQSKMSPAPVRRVCANAMFHKCDPKTEMISTTESEVSPACDVHKETPHPEGAASRQKEDAVVATSSQPGSSDESVPSSRRPSVSTCDLPVSEQPKGTHSAVPASVHIRRSSSVPCKSGNNRDSSSSNDSGVSTGSLKQGGGDFSEFELPLTTSVSAKKHQYSIARHPGYVTNCLHSSLPRRSKSVDPLRDITFQFQKIKVPAKSSSAEAEVPVCPKARGFQSPGGESAVVAPYMDSRSTSSGTSDMSDYIETLSVSSHSSSDVQDALLLGRQATTTLRPRSGKEYQLIDRSILDGEMKQGDKAGHPLRTIGGQYANITPVPEKSESPSPGYMSGSPGQERDEQPLILHNFATK